MKIRSMNKLGIEVFNTHIDDLRAGRAASLPEKFLFNDKYSVEIGGEASDLDNLDLDDKYKTAVGLDAIVESLKLKSAERDIGFWVWCSAYLFDSLCKQNRGGIKKPGESAIWIAQPDVWRRYYRHYLASIWRVYSGQKHLGVKLKVLLSGPVNTPGELWGQIVAYQWIVANSSLVEAVHDLYWDVDKNKRKHGAGGESPRRLVKVLKQLARTWDFQSMTSAQILAMLPHEFDRFQPNNVIAYSAG